MAEYSEEEVNRMLSEQKMYLRLDGMEAKITAFSTSFTEYANREKINQEQIMAKIMEGSNDRRKCEDRIKSEIKDNHESYHSLFVKKAELRIYAFLIVTAVTITAGFITWLGVQTSSKTYDESMHTILQKIERMVNHE